MVKCPDLPPPSGDANRPIYLPLSAYLPAGGGGGLEGEGRGLRWSGTGDGNKQIKAGDLKQISVIKTVAKSSLAYFIS